MGIYRRDEGDASARFYPGDAYKYPPPTCGPNNCIIWSFFSRFLGNFGACYTLTRLHSVKFLFYSYKSEHATWLLSRIIFFSVIIEGQLPKCTKTHVKLHEIAYKLSINCLLLEVLRPCSRLRIGSDAPTQNVLSAGTLHWTRWGSLYRLYSVSPGLL